MNAADRTDVLVIGAGPVGLTLASELLRHGARVRVVERKTGPNLEPNAAIVHVRTLEILCAMGAVEGFLREGYPLPGLSAHALGRHIGFVNLDGVDSPFPRPRTIGQQHTERLLGEHFERLGGRIERGVEALAIEQDERGARISLRHLGEGNRVEMAEAAWVVGCEGSKSVTREAAGIAFEGKRYAGKEFLQIEANLRWSFPHGFGYLFNSGENIVLCFPYDDAGSYRIICARDDANPENHEKPSLEEIEAILRATADSSAEIYEPRWFNRFRSGHRMAAHFRAGRLFLAGDAGHVHVPIGGQGMNFGMHDAFNLGWKLAAVVKGEAPLALLDSYEAERRPADEGLVRFTDRAFQILIGHSRGTARAMRVLGPTVFGLPTVQRRIGRALGEMEVAYGASALSEDHGGSGGPEAGERAPDAVVVAMPERRTRHLFDLMRGTGWTLFLFGGRGEAGELERARRLAAGLGLDYAGRLSVYLIMSGEVTVPLPAGLSLVMDRDGYAKAKYGIGPLPCFYLVRPDWYVGFRGGVEFGGDLRRYLEGVFV